MVSMSSRQELVTLDFEHEFKLGGRLPRAEVQFETHGTLSPDGDNAILICTPLTMDSHVSGEDPSGDPKKAGWWNFLVGSGLAVDTDRHFVICSNVLGGCKGTSGPISIDPKTKEPYRTDFPEVRVEDMVALQKRLIDHLGVKKLYAVIGGSLGGMQALQWAVAFPDMVERCIAIATGSRLSCQGLAFDVVGRQCITSDPSWKDGEYPLDGEDSVGGLALARMIGHITYISKNIMDQKFGRRLQDGQKGEGFATQFAVESFLKYNSERFIHRFDPNSYLYLSKAMDTFDLEEGFASLKDSLARAKSQFLIISFSSDWLFTPEDSIQLASCLLQHRLPVTYANIDTELGHDAFLIDAPEIASMKRLVGGFLEAT